MARRDNDPELMRRYGQFRTLSSKLGSVRTLCLAGILALAFVRGKLKPESFLRVRNPFHGGHRNLELAIAKGADSDCRNRPKPFDHPKITLWHGQPFSATAEREAFFFADRYFETEALARAIVVVL